MIDHVLLIASIIGAIATIIGAAYKLMKMFHSVMSEIEGVKDSLRQNELHILKLAILEENMPPAERIKCGERYIALGGNGQIKKIVEKLMKETDDIVEALKKNKDLQSYNEEELVKLLEKIRENKKK
jgi:hypothetical protein